MSVHRWLAFGLALTTLAACDTPLTGPDGPVSQLSQHDDGDDGDDDQEVELSGSAFVTSGSGLRVVDVDAESEDGSVEGTYTVTLTGPGLFFTVDVSCLAAAGDTAWIAGHISDTNASVIRLGSVSYFYAIDNGEEDDEGGPADIISTARFNDVEGEDLRFCQERPLLLPSQPIEGGDLEIEIDD